MPNATRRINRGRGHSYLLDGERADGVTWIVSNGVPKPALIDWAARTTAGYAIDHWDELAELKASERLRKLEKARWAETDTAAVRGTNVHSLAQQLAAGEEVDVPEHLVGHVDAYLSFARDWEPEEIIVESVVAHRRYRYMGTLDLIARLADRPDVAAGLEDRRIRDLARDRAAAVRLPQRRLLPRRPGQRAANAHRRPDRLRVAARRRL